MKQGWHDGLQELTGGPSKKLLSKHVVKEIGQPGCVMRVSEMPTSPEVL